MSVAPNITEQPEILKAREALQKLKEEMAQNNPSRQCPVSKTSAHGDGNTILTPKKCPVTHKPKTRYEEMEKDFTTPGKPSSLECPFAEMARNGTINSSGDADPIAAEFHADSLSARSLDEARACGKCPMRFMDKHSPEEIAEYFEKHKHELPRSHEICVKRYQKNESSIRQLDEKYGNIVSMIQGLGNKHKQYLRSEDQENQSGTDQKSNEAVAQWAKDVDESVDGGVIETKDAERVSRFDKPLADIRVGESPSRPWGISVPVNRPIAPSATASQQDHTRSAAKPKTTSRASEPAFETRSATGRSHRSRSTATTSKSHRRREPQIVINGPVFLGYSAEDAAVFLQRMRSGRSEFAE